MISPNQELLPDVKLVNNYIGVLEFIAGSLSTDCNIAFMGHDFYHRLIDVQTAIRELRNSYINSFKFQSYE